MTADNTTTNTAAESPTATTVSPTTTTSVPSLSHATFAGRTPAGTEQPVTISKNGIRHVRRLPNGEEKEVLAIGLACSECFSGQNLYKILKPGFEYEARVMQELMMNAPAGPLSIHTSAGVPEALEGFLDALTPHIPWKQNEGDDNNSNNKQEEELDWCVSLQLEGASAVWAGIDMLMQLRILETGEKERTKVAVGSTSYHGPPSTSFGGKSPLWHKHYQIAYPIPSPGVEIDEDALLEQFQIFLDTHGHEIGVILFEPQWGSSQVGYPWPRTLLKRYIELAKKYNLKILCDEIMCGLGRHGKGTLFLSEAWDLDPDAVTFGKAIGGGVYPLSGAILKRGRTLLQRNKATVMQSHTLSGSSVRALMAGTEVLKEISTRFTTIRKLGEEMEHIFRYITKIAEGMVICQGHGLLWGGLVTKNGQNEDPQFRATVVSTLKKSCDEAGVLPYFVPAGGFMVSPIFDVDVGTIYEIGERLEKAIVATKEAVGWVQLPESVEKALIAKHGRQFSITKFAEQISSDKCNPFLHETRSCTSCSCFVSTTVRSRFVSYTKAIL